MNLLLSCFESIAGCRCSFVSDVIVLVMKFTSMSCKIRYKAEQGCVLLIKWVESSDFSIQSLQCVINNCNP